MVNGHSFILIREMVALVRHALAEVCAVPVSLVIHTFYLKLFLNGSCIKNIAISCTCPTQIHTMSLKT